VIKKSATMMVTAILSIGLVACNNTDKNDLNNDRVGMNNRDNGVFNVGNGKDNGIDHNGPLTEDYTNNDNNDSDLDRNLTNDNRNDHDFDLNLFDGNDNNRKNRRNNDDMISAYQTNLNSDQYPHTRAILIRDAKYQYVKIDPKQGNWFQTGVINLPPNFNFQNPIAQAPTGQQAQPAPAQPAPKQTTPAPQAKPSPAPAPQQKAQPAPQTQTPPQKPAQRSTTPATGGNSQYVQQVIDLTNQQRSKNGLPALKADTQLNSVAQKKALDMQQNHYFSHTSPTYGSPFDMMRDFGVTYKSAGENIAQGQQTPQEVVTAWMNSEGHRKNILSASYTHIGIGYEASGKHWVQMFIGK
jgi:uncharacterized YkwD family protein